jgi:hypothetical protein
LRWDLPWRHHLFIVAGDEDQSQNAVDVWSYLIIEIMIYAYSCTNTANIHTIG